MANDQELVEQLFEAALVVEPAERASFLDQVCGDDRELKTAVERLLTLDARAGSFLQKPLFEPQPASSSRTGPGLGQIGIDAGGIGEHPAFVSQLQPGDNLIDRFLIVRFIARGGMGEVYEVEDRHLRGVHLALKTVLSQVATDPAMQDRFQREVLIAREVVHANLCPIYDIFHCYHKLRPLTFLTMKLLPGETLAARIKREGQIPLREAEVIIEQVAAALTAVHDAGVLHRDIKAANIILDGRGEQVRACVTDFGLARSFGSENTVLTVDGVVGTPGYIAPELFHGSAPTKASDVYAFGILVYEMLTGQLPATDPELEDVRASAMEKLPPSWRTFVNGCIESRASRRYQTFAQAMVAFREADSSPWIKPQPLHLSRRRMLGLSTGAAVALAGGVWWKWTDVRFWLEPLPEKRFVALMAWPAASSDATAIVSTVLDSIETCLARAEAYVKDLLVISSSDPAFGGSPSPATPVDTVSSLGANLVLAASLQSTATAVTLFLRVLNPTTQQVLRRDHVTCEPAQLGGLAGKGAVAALRLLGLPRKQVLLKDADELKHVSADVVRIFSEAEQLADQPNETGLNAAILKYQQALTADPHFALGYARLAMAYIKQHLQTGDAATLRLAGSNAALALHYNPDSAKGLLSQALAYLYSGQTELAMTYFAKCLKADPGNPETLVYKAQAFRDMGLWSKAEDVYREILRDRPNYWLAYEELGWILARQAKYAEATDAFGAAVATAPNVALPLANLSSMYMEIGKNNEARDAAVRSLNIRPTSAAYLILGDLAFSDGKYKDSLDNYQKAAGLNRNLHLIWRNIGDCYAVLNDPSKVKESYAKAAATLSEELKVNPRRGPSWMTLAFYHAKIGAATDAQFDIKNAEARGASDVGSQFMKVQALAVLGRKKEALDLLLSCIDKGLSPLEVHAALDLKDLEKDPHYLARVSAMHNHNQPTAS